MRLHSFFVVLFTKQFVKRCALEQVAEGERLIAIATPTGS